MSAVGSITKTNAKRAARIATMNITARTVEGGIMVDSTVTKNLENPGMEKCSTTRHPRWMGTPRKIRVILMFLLYILQVQVQDMRYYISRTSI